MATAEELSRRTRRSDAPSIAVLPFSNLSRDPDQHYFADGISEDIITALSRFGTFHVIARNSCFTYKGRTVDARRVAAELAVQYVLEGSVRRAGERLRVTAQLNDAENRQAIWANRFDGRIEDVFDVQDEITSRIAAAISPAVTQSELARALKWGTTDLTAWDLILRASHHYAKLTPTDLEKAEDCAARACALDPQSSTALAWRANILCTQDMMTYVAAPSEAIRDSIDLARQALERDQLNAFALAVLGFGLFGQRAWDQALEYGRESTRINPNLVTGWTCVGTVQAFCGEHDEAIAAIDHAIALSPRDPLIGMWIAQQAIAAFVTGRYDETLMYGRRAIQRAPGFVGAHRVSAAALAQLDRLDEARREVGEALRILPELTVSLTRQNMPFRDEEAAERYCAALRRAGMPE